MSDIRFTAVRKFGLENGKEWNEYINWSGLNQLKRVISLDAILCPPVFPDSLDSVWAQFAFTNLDELLNQLGEHHHADVLAGSLNPKSDISGLFKDGRFTFAGYDIIEGHGNSVITNCGKWDELFIRSDLNENGLMASYNRAWKLNLDYQSKYPEKNNLRGELWALWVMNNAV